MNREECRFYHALCFFRSGRVGSGETSIVGGYSMYICMYIWDWRSWFVGMGRDIFILNRDMGWGCIDNIDLVGR